MVVQEIVDGKFILLDGVFHLNQGEFRYSDGDVAESYIEEVVRQASDISSSSTELENKSLDWSSRYHFSRSRANAFRALKLKPSATILEIGSGCGAITRYLGETGCSVVAVEGSPRRARITRSRTRDLNNVTVICGSFADLKIKKRFDYVVCNGVLEYAPLFITGDNAAQSFMRRVADVLSESGSLLLGIENQLGLRYFASGREEHTGILYDGIEGYVRYPKGAKTYSKAALLGLLSGHFKTVQVLLPLPDYKFPRAIIREELTQLVDCAEMFGVMEDYAYPTMVRANFHQRLAWRNVGEAKLLPELANSFFIIASKAGDDTLDDDWQGEIFKQNGDPTAISSVRIVTRVINDVTSVGVIQHDTSQRARSEEFTPWINGQSVHCAVSAALICSDPVSLADTLTVPLTAWWTAVRPEKGREIRGINADAIWRNAILTDKGVVLIDQELERNEAVSGALLIYRAILNFVSDEMPFIHRWAAKNRSLSEKDLVRVVAAVVGVGVSRLDLIKAVREEINLQAELGYTRSNYMARLLRLVIPLVYLRTITDLRTRAKLLWRKGQNCLSVAKKSRS